MSLQDVLSGEAKWHIECADSREFVKSIPDNTLDSVSCDPPYFISFMSEGWDKMKDQAALDPAFWRDVMRAMKPGAYLTAFGFPRTYHRLAVAIEDAGFEVRDLISWLYGEAMPKGQHNVGRAIDELAGVKHLREVTSTYRVGGNALTPTSEKGGTYSVGAENSPAGELTRTAPYSDAAKQWEDWGSLLKVAHEPICLARKPFSCTLEANVLAWGTGALNLGACRVATDWNEPDRPASWKRSGHTKKPNEAKIAAPPGKGIQLHPGGRHPPDVLFDEFVAGLLDDETGKLVSRYFPALPGVYSPKASRKERDAGLERWPVRSSGQATKRKEGSAGIGPHAGAGRTGGSRNPRVTVKSMDAVRWLLRLTTKRGGLTFDPFLGSGTTICAALLEQMLCIGCEMDCLAAGAAYDRAIHWERVAIGASPQAKATSTNSDEPNQPSLFGDVTG